MNQDERKTAARRMMLLIAAAGVIIGLYGFRLIFLQLVNGDSFKAQATNTTDYKFTVTAARGDIVDSKGERIASSVTGYNVVLNKLLMGDEDLDALLQKLVGLLGENGESWNDRGGRCRRALCVHGGERQRRRAALPCRHEGEPGPAAVCHRRRCDGKAGGGL